MRAREILEWYERARPIILRHPWLRGTVKDIMDIIPYLRRRTLSGVFEDFFAVIKDAASTVWNTVKPYLTPEQQRQTVASTASTMKEFTQDVLRKAEMLKNTFKAPGEYIKLGETGAHVKWLQTLINDLGFGPIEVDGIYGPKTMEAVKRLQKWLGVEVDGYFGYFTAQALYNKLREETQKPGWWERLMNTVIPVVAYAIKHPEIQDKYEDFVRQSVWYKKPVVTPVPEEERKKIPWPIIVGGGILLVVLLSRKEEKK